MLENEAHRDPLKFSEDCCSLEDKHRFVQTFYTAVGLPDPTNSANALTISLDQWVHFSKG